MNKTQKLIRLLLLLVGNRRYSKEELCNKLELNERTLYRYLQDIEACGFILEREQSAYYITPNHYSKSLSHILHFSADELELLTSSMQVVEEYNMPIAESLMKKLVTVYDHKLWNKDLESSFQNKIRQIKIALDQKQTVLLKDYRSGNRAQIMDREIEPIAFINSYKAIWGLDITDLKVKQFVLSRSADVVLLDRKWNHKDLHQIPLIDVFRMTGNKKDKRVSFNMSLLAHNLLKDEYPQASKFVTIKDDVYHLNLKVAKYEGVGRFVLGLISQIDHIEPKEFRDYLLKQMNHNTLVKKDK